MTAGFNPNSGGGTAFTPLIWAARRGHVAAVRRLVAVGADVNLTSGVNDWTPLMHAVHKGRTDAALALLELGADISGGRGRRTLVLGVGYGNAALTRALLARGVDPHVDLGGGPSLLALAAAGPYEIDYRWNGCMPHTDTVRALLTRAPDLTLHDSYFDNYAIAYVRRRNCREMLTLLEPRAAAFRASR